MKNKEQDPIPDLDIPDTPAEGLTWAMLPQKRPHDFEVLLRATLFICVLIGWTWVGPSTNSSKISTCSVFFKRLHVLKFQNSYCFLFHFQTSPCLHFLLKILDCLELGSLSILAKRLRAF